MNKAVLLSVFCVINSIQAASDSENLRCLVCKAAIDEFGVAVKKLDPAIQTEIGGYKVDAEGNLKKQTISQAKSETVLSDVIDTVCKAMDDYVRVTWKSNGTLTIMKMIIDGQMNVNFGNVDFVTDDDLNKSLKYYCEGIVEEYEEVIINYYANEADDIKMKVCRDEAKLCIDDDVSDSNGYDVSDDEEDEVDREEL